VVVRNLARLPCVHDVACFLLLSARAEAIQAWEREVAERKASGVVAPADDEGDMAFDEGVDIEAATAAAATAAAAAELEHRKLVSALLLLFTAWLFVLVMQPMFVVSACPDAAQAAIRRFGGLNP
jgi:hypothetical protein